VDLGRKYSTFLSQLKAHGPWFVFTVYCLRETCTFTRFVFFSQRPRWNRRGVDRCALLLASIVRGTRAGDPGPGAMLRGPGANVRRPWKLKNGKKPLPRLKKTNVHGARALDRGQMPGAAGAFPAANRRGQFDYTLGGGPNLAKLHAGRGSRANCCGFWACSGANKPRATGRGTFQAAPGRPDSYEAPWRVVYWPAIRAQRAILRG